MPEVSGSSPLTLKANLNKPKITYCSYNLYSNLVKNCKLLNPNKYQK